MSGTNTPKTALCFHLVKLYKILLCFVLGHIVSEIRKNFFLLSPSFWTNKNIEQIFLSCYTFFIDLGSTCPYSGSKEEWQQSSVETRFFSWKVLLSQTRRMFLQTVVLPFCIHATILTNTTAYADRLPLSTSFWPSGVIFSMFDVNHDWRFFMPAKKQLPTK